MDGEQTVSEWKSQEMVVSREGEPEDALITGQGSKPEENWADFEGKLNQESES